MYVVGIDLSGPSNVADTVATVGVIKPGQLIVKEYREGLSDEAILNLVGELVAGGDVAVGLDAPLSYNPGGGLRPSDRSLRVETMAAGMHTGSVMPPTFNRMAYLTLRGITVARILNDIFMQKVRMVEVHPGAALALRGAPIEAVRRFKKEPAARMELLEWLEANGLVGALTDAPSDHYVAACAAAYATWKWRVDEPAWVRRAEPPRHPFDFSV